jgi:hypothetical protein
MTKCKPAGVCGWMCMCMTDYRTFGLYAERSDMGRASIVHVVLV